MKSIKLAIGVVPETEALNELIRATFFKVDGVLVERTANGYIVFGREYNTMSGVQNAIAASRNALAQSIRK